MGRVGLQVRVADVGGDFSSHIALGLAVFQSVENESQVLRVVRFAARILWQRKEKEKARTKTERKELNAKNMNNSRSQREKGRKTLKISVVRG
jgi:hypothetical protein